MAAFATAPLSLLVPVFGLLGSAVIFNENVSLNKIVAAALFLAPACLLVGLYVVYPILYTIYLSFFEWDGLAEKSFVGLANYAELWHSATFFTALKNNAIWLGLFLLAPPAGLAVALYLNQQVRGIRLVKSLFFAPFVLSGVVVGLIFSWFYDPTFGLLALILGHGVPVLGDPRYVTYGIIFAALWPQTAYCMILFLTGLTSINAEQVEAALGRLAARETSPMPSTTPTLISTA